MRTAFSDIEVMARGGTKAKVAFQSMSAWVIEKVTRRPLRVPVA